MDGGAWWAAVNGIAKRWTRLSDFTFTFHFHALEKEMATHSSILAWRIPGTAEPGGLPSMGSHRVELKWLSSSSSKYVFTGGNTVYIEFSTIWSLRHPLGFLEHIACRLQGTSLVAQMVMNLPVMQETWVQSLGWEDPLEEDMATLSSIPA